MSKPSKSYRKRDIGGRPLSPETLMLGYGYNPKQSEGAIKPPIFQTSTFAFESAEHGEQSFRAARGVPLADDPLDPGLAYSRINNPDVEILEDRLTIYDGAEAAVAFSSGMGAITTAILAVAGAGSVVLHSSPLYGGTESLIRNVLPRFGIKTVEFPATADEATLARAIVEARTLGPLAVIYTETPANPTNELVDLALVARLAREPFAAANGVAPVVMTDNTYLGPVAQFPIEHGVDVVLYSLTKYVGGHSDLVAGAALGSAAHMAKVRGLRTLFGTNPDPHTCWLLLRSMETVRLRMEASFANARKLAVFLAAHPKVEVVRFLDFLPEGSAQREIFERQCLSAGSTFSFDVVGGKDAAFRVLNRLQVAKLAVSLGGTETLMCHPASTTHSGVDPALRARLGVTEGLIRISVGIENADDLIADLSQALEAV
jgi:cystathionine gamma-synthase/methionine-gamma-lyase